MTRETIVAALMAAQAGTGGYHTSGTVPVSPSVMATGMYQATADGNARLQLLVLWRGTPGWFMKDGAGRSGSSTAQTGMAASQGGVTNQVIVMQVRQGGLELNLQFDEAQGKVWIQDREVPLGGGNVVLVDAVDRPEGPIVGRVLRVEPEIEKAAGDRARFVQPQVVIRRSPELVAYLQCDRQFDDPRPYVQQMLKAMCDAVMLP